MIIVDVRTIYKFDTAGFWVTMFPVVERSPERLKYRVVHSHSRGTTLDVTEQSLKYLLEFEAVESRGGAHRNQRMRLWGTQISRS